ncbi:Tetratricopeptide-like helical domain containing protein [Parasponia andersonii]|uniref:Tetratricopeptide-like helical domain containing protein n=1 Tax=Parasponia andersonii TaxID=3476 RepID=A0A2P5D6W2_PARAD|nr:Tetratricopeptide-like helical domain containing protein [Parasponia andersonii]
MGIRVISPRSCQSIQLKGPLPRYSSSFKLPYGISFPTKPFGKNQALAYGLALRSLDSFGLRQSKACSASFGDFSDDEFSNQIEELAQKFNIPDDDHDDDEKENETASLASKVSLNLKYPDEESNKISGFSVPFSSFKFDSLRPSLFGIEPEPPDWPERSEIVRASIERKANSVELPLSLRIIKRKQRKLEESFREAGELTYCSVNKAFSYMVFIIRELQTCALSIRESLYYEDLQEIIAKMQREMDISFIWLFQQVFSRTPTLMVYLMVLLANFTIKSMDDNACCGAILVPGIAETSSMTETKNQNRLKLGDVSSVNALCLPSYNEVVKQTPNGAKNGFSGDQENPLGTGTKGGDRQLGRLSVSIQFPHFVPDERNGVPFFGKEELNTEEEMNLWDSVLEEASRMQAEFWGEALDHETLQQLVSPFTVVLEADDYEHYFRTDLSYQMALARELNNPLLLSNYAQFLYLVYHDHNRAEECFRRAVEAEPPDAETLSRYAEFLWIVRKDLWGAEERYQQAMAVESDNPYHASKYANFLWSTGGDETCFPLDSSHENYNRVL